MQRRELYAGIVEVGQLHPKNVIDLPSSIEARLERAIAAFDSGDTSPLLLKEFLDLVDKGDKEANYFVGMIYEDGVCGVPQNLESAFFYYQKSVEGFGYLEGYLALARLFYHGCGVKQDFNKAFEYYMHVVNQKDHLVAFFMLGRMYQRGEGVGVDFKEARKWFERAIAKGSIYGMLNLAMLEIEEGHWFRSLVLRLNASWIAIFLARKNKRDIRLRGS